MASNIMQNGRKQFINSYSYHVSTHIIHLSAYNSSVSNCARKWKLEWMSFYVMQCGAQCNELNMNITQNHRCLPKWWAGVKSINSRASNDWACSKTAHRPWWRCVRSRYLPARGVAKNKQIEIKHWLLMERSRQMFDRIDASIPVQANFDRRFLAHQQWIRVPIVYSKVFPRCSSSLRSAMPWIRNSSRGATCTQIMSKHLQIYRFTAFIVPNCGSQSHQQNQKSLNEQEHAIVNLYTSISAFVRCAHNTLSCAYAQQITNCWWMFSLRACYTRAVVTQRTECVPVTRTYEYLSQYVRCSCTFTWHNLM